MLKKTLKYLHLWLGLLSGILIFIIAITGCIYVFSEEIKEFTHRDRNVIVAPLNTKKLPLSDLVNIAENIFDKKYTFQNIIIPNFPNSSVSIIFEEIDEEGFWYPDYMVFNKTVYLNPYTGGIIKVENTKWEFFNVIFWIHITLFMGYNSTSSIIIISTICVFLVMLISGILLWWPNKKQRKQSFGFKWKKTTRWKRKNYDVHRIFGFYIFLFSLLIALTGLFWISDSFNKSVKWIANGGEHIIEKELPIIKSINKPEDPLETIYKKVIKDIPQSKYILIRKHPNETVPYIVRSYLNETINYKRVEMYFDKSSATLISKEFFENKNNGEKIQALNYDLHVGSIGGFPTKIIAFFVSLLIASLPISGTLIWLGKKKVTKKNLNKLLVKN